MQGTLQFQDEEERRLVKEPDRDAPESEVEPDSAADYVQHVRERFQVMKDADDVQRTRSIEEVEFNSGKHWEDEMRKEREDKDRVIIEINRTPQYLNQVANEQRMTRPSILVKPNGNGADEDNAQIKQGIIRSIERRSGAQNIRDDSFYRMLEKGWTYWRVNVQYENEKSFKQAIRTGRFANDFSVYHDPAATEYDLTDAADWVITDDMPIDQFEQEWPWADVTSLSDFQALGDEEKEWISDGTIRVAEYWENRKDKEKLYMLADDPMGDGRWEDELQEHEGKLVGVAYLGDEPIWRWSFKTRIMWAKVSATQILEGNADRTGPREYIKGAKYVPIVPLMGRRILVKKKYIWTGMVRDAIEPCLASDYWLSAITEMVALGPKAPWVVAYESIAQYREMWDQSNIENYAALFYDAKDEEGNDLPAPFRNFGEPPIQAMTFILNYAEQDLKRVMGIYNPSLGAPSNETSGVAIRNRQNESDVANFNYVDNLKRSEEHEAKIYLDLIPKVYDSAQVIEMVRPDGQTQTALINKEFKDPKTGAMKKYDMAKGDYDVEVEIGASAATRREAAAQGILDYLKVDQEAAPLVGYLLADNLDFPDKDQMVKILKARAIKLGAPIDDGNNQVNDKNIPPQFMAQYQQQAQALEQVTAALKQLQQDVATDKAKYEYQKEIEFIKMVSGERRDRERNDVQVLVAELSAKSQADMMMIKNMFDQWKTDQTKPDPTPAEFDFDPTSGALMAPGQQTAIPTGGPGGQQN